MTNEGSLTSGLKASLEASENRSSVGKVIEKHKAQNSIERDPKIKLAVTLDRHFHARIKVHAATQFRTIEEIAREALEEYMERHS